MMICIFLLHKSVKKKTEFPNLIHFSAELGILVCENGSVSSAFINSSALLLLCLNCMGNKK